MRIAEINDIASVASGLADGLSARGHEVTVIRPRLVGGGLPWMVKPVVSPVRAVEWAQIIRMVQAGHYDAVHIHYAYLGMLGILGKFPYLLHCHGTDVREITPFTRPMIERALRAADTVYYATPDLASFVLERRPDARFLPNPVDSQQFAPTRPACDSAKVLIACALNEIKGSSRLLDACRRLARERPDIEITAFDGGEHAAEFALLPNVTLVPRMPRSRLPGLIGQQGVVMGQVLLGSLGMAELEAMACARPVIAWYSYNRAYTEPPPVVRAVDGYDIAAAVARLVDDPGQRDEIGSASRAWVERFHGLAAIAATVERDAGELVRRQRARRGGAA
jgi:glycosyltransferase involved in cell wall biosynthesis